MSERAYNFFMNMATTAMLLGGAILVVGWIAQVMM